MIYFFDSWAVPMNQKNKSFVQKKILTPPKAALFARKFLTAYCILETVLIPNHFRGFHTVRHNIRIGIIFFYFI